MANYSVVGQSVYRTDANPKVTGRALHVGNIEMPGMLHVAVLRSPYAHARITRIEKSKAEAAAGRRRRVDRRGDREDAGRRSALRSGVSRPADSRRGESLL